jgi:hypothetical protein
MEERNSVGRRRGCLLILWLPPVMLLDSADFVSFPLAMAIGRQWSLGMKRLVGRRAPSAFRRAARNPNNGPMLGHSLWLTFSQFRGFEQQPQQPQPTDLCSGTQYALYILHEKMVNETVHVHAKKALGY